MSTTTRRTYTRALALAGAPLFLGAALGVPAPAAHAAPAAPAAPAALTRTAPTPTVATTPLTKQQKSVRMGQRAVQIASSRKGSPYSYGSEGPHRFDCSGLTRWTFKRLGKQLPHSSSAQYGRVKHVRKADRRKGDLVFFHDGGGIYHVAIYAGNGKIWHAPRTGERVKKERIWTGSVYYGRVR